jgi:cation diffusion facilitator CzcD-associated flavoprotein CzcO
MTELIDTVVVGAGHAGLALSSCLAKSAIDHVVLERGDVAQRWRSERWDSLVFQFPNWSLQLPDYAYRGENPDGYASKDEFIRFLENYTSTIRAPVRRGQVRLNTDIHETDLHVEMIPSSGSQNLVFCLTLPVARALLDGLPRWVAKIERKKPASH